MNTDINTWKNISDEELYNNFCKSRFINRFTKKYGVISEDKKNIIIKCIRVIEKNRNKYTLYDMEAVYRLCFYNNGYEILNNLENYIKIKKWSNTLENFISAYGNEVGIKKFNEYTESVSIRNSKKNYQTDEYIAKKYSISIEDAKIKKLNSRKQAHITRKKKYGEDHYKKSSCLNVNYYISRGFDISCIDKLRNDALKKVKLDKNTYLEKYKDNGEEKFLEMIEKRRNTLTKKIQENNINYKENISETASKESMKFFDSLIIALKSYIDLGTIHYGKKGYLSEWRIWNDEINKVYFVDFYLPKYKIAIEYDNVSYHCIDPNNWPEKHIHLKENNEYYYDYDVNRKEFIRKNVNLLIVIRSDNIDFISTINTILLFVEEYNEKI